jgi:hypothetical protein
MSRKKDDKHTDLEGYRQGFVGVEVGRRLG